MLYSGVLWAIDLLTHLLHFFVVLPLFFIILLCSYHFFYHFVVVIAFFFYAMSDDLSHFNAWKTVMFFFTPISWTLVRRSLVEKVIFSERVHVHHCLRVYPFYYVFSEEFVYWYSEYAPKKKKKKKKKKTKKTKKQKTKKRKKMNEKKGNKRMYLCMYIVPFFIECRYWSLIAILLSQLLMKVCMWTFRRLSPPCVYFVMYLMREKWMAFS